MVKIWNYDTIISRLKEDGRTLTLISKDVKNCNDKVIFKCNICGREWKTTWTTVKSGCGCRKCSGSLKLTIEEIKEKLYSINKNVKIKSDSYTNAHAKLDCECLICGCEWKSTWNTLSGNKGCPTCAIKNRADSLRYNIDFIVNFINEKHPNIVLHSKEYINAREKLDCECSICGLRWNPTYDRLKAGSGCPKCSDSNHISVFNEMSAEINKEEWLKIRAKLYISKFYDDIEHFYKIGITTLDTKRRFSLIPYEYTEIDVFEFTLYDAIAIEKIIHKNMVEYSYIPNKNFGGYTECFSEVDLTKIKELINDYKRSDCFGS